MPGRTAEADARAWLARWDRQQTLYLPYREQRFRAMLDALAADLPERFLAVDLACGPGSLTERLVARFPGARVQAVDFDPVLLDLGRTALHELHQRVAWIEADLRAPGWPELLPTRPVDAVLSTTALHWFDEPTLRRIYRDLGALLRPGGLLLNGDQLPYGPGDEPLDRLATEVRHRAEAEARSRPGAEGWDEWWASLRRDGHRDPLFAERDRRYPKAHGGEPALPLSVHEEALRAAGFSNVGVVWQQFDNRVLLAIR